MEGSKRTPRAKSLAGLVKEMFHERAICLLRGTTERGRIELGSYSPSLLAGMGCPFNLADGHCQEGHPMSMACTMPGTGSRTPKTAATVKTVVGMMSSRSGAIPHPARLVKTLKLAVTNSSPRLHGGETMHAGG